MKKIKLLVAALALIAAGSTAAFAQENIIARGNMEGSNVNEWVAEGSTLSLQAGKGIGGSTALCVRGKYNWSGTGKDVTRNFNPNDDATYYIEVWYKADPADKQTRTSDIALALQPAGEENPDNFLYFGLDDCGGKYTGGQVAFTNKEYTKACGTVTGSELKAALKGRRCENATIYFKIDNPLRPYYIDNVVFKKLK